MTDTAATPEAEAPPAEPEQAEQAAAPVPAVREAPLLGELETIPQGGEMRALLQWANIFAAAELVPKALMNKPNDVLLVLMTARDLGLSATTALRECHPIEGRVTCSPKLRLAMVRTRGLGLVWADPDNGDSSATWYARRHDTPDVVFKSTVTWAEAKRAGLAGRDCVSASEHAQRRDGKCGCKSNWHNWGPRMLSWRALGFLLDDAFSEVGTGLYDADSLGAVTDDEGRPIIDVEEVGVPEGFRAPRTDRQRRAERGPGPDDPAPEEEITALRARIKALPGEVVMLLADRWTRVADGEDRPFLPTRDGTPVSAGLTVGEMRRASALVKSFERDVERGKYNAEEPDQPDEPDDPFAGCETYQDVWDAVHAYQSREAVEEQLQVEDAGWVDPAWTDLQYAAALVLAVCERRGIEVPADQLPADEPDPAAGYAPGDREHDPNVCQEGPDCPACLAVVAETERAIQTGHDDDEAPVAGGPAVDEAAAFIDKAKARARQDVAGPAGSFAGTASDPPEWPPGHEPL